jgi:tyrosyl-tRNA synthetase
MITKENFGGIAVADLLVMTGLAKSKSEARRGIQQGAVRMNDRKITDPTMRVGWLKKDDGTFEVWSLEESNEV